MPQKKRLNVPRIKELKTGWPNGTRLAVHIVQTKEYVRIFTKREFDFLKSAPENKFGAVLRNGQFFITCSYNNYSKVIKQFTEYMEKLIFSLMLKQEGKGDSKNSSNRGDSKSSGDNSGDSPKDNAKDKGKKSKPIFSGLRSRARGDEQTKDDRGGDKKDRVAPESDQQSK